MSLRYRYTRGYLARRIGNTVLVFFVLIIINFFLSRAMPGNFAVIYLAQASKDIGNLDPASRQALLERITQLFGLNLPIQVQFLKYLEDLLSFPPNFGFSFQYYPATAWSIIAIALPWTLLLVVSSQIASWGVGIVLGMSMALRKGSRFDRLLQPLNVSILTIPRFWLAMIFIIVFAIELRILPPGSAYNLTPTVPSILIHMILPFSVLVITTFPSHTIVVRNSAVEILSSDFVTAMRAQGLGGWVFLRRVLKNSLLPSITVLFLSFGEVIGGVYIIEYTFSYPGLGSVLADAVFARDFPVLQAALFITVAVVLIANLAADLVYPLVDPRISYTH
jgi:peptide/nickel transport system permease protein